MDTLKDICTYFLRHHPAKSLSNAKLTKMVYLADWRNVLQNGSQITNIEWYFDTYGPFVWDINNLTESDNAFKNFVVTADNGVVLRRVKLKKRNTAIALSEKAKSILDHVLEKAGLLAWREFLQLVYSTYPIASNEQFISLDLVASGQEYKASPYWNDEDAAPPN